MRTVTLLRETDGSYLIAQEAARGAQLVLPDREFPQYAPEVLVPLRAFTQDGTQRYSLPRGCADLLERYGLRPRLLAPGLVRASALTGAHGALFVGGADIEPKWYGAQSHPLTCVTEPVRDALEIQLLRSLILPREIPYLGLCRGAQALAVAAGGSLHQHVPDLGGSIEHWEDAQGADARHTLFLESKSRCERILGLRCVRGNSHHHQSIDHPGKGMRIAGVTADGVVELLEAQSPWHWCVGIQGHPERDPSRELEPLVASFANAVYVRQNL